MAKKINNETEIMKSVMEVSTINLVHRQNMVKLLELLNNYTTKTLELDKKSVGILMELKKLVDKNEKR